MQAQLDFKDNQYFINEVVAIHFFYKVIEQELLTDKETIIHEPVDKYILTVSNIFGYDLPNNMNLFTWGNVVRHDGSNIVIEFSKNGNDLVYLVEMGEKSNSIQIKEDFYDDEILLEFVDTPEKGSTTNFTRKVKNMEYIYKDSQIVIKMDHKNFNFIKSLSKAKKNFVKFITLDIETRTIDNIMIPYCICYYDGVNEFSFYLTDYKSSEAMISACLESILTNDKYNNHIVYAHNFSRFDGIFIIKILVLLARELKLKISIIKRDSDFINISIKGESTGFNINFRDSLLLLPTSLRKLAKSFGVMEKSIFPYAFVNDPNLDLDYKGIVPDFKYFSDLSLVDYNNYTQNFNIWSLKYETIKYCLQDCIVLYQVLKNFSQSIFKDLKVNLKFLL